MSCADTSCIVKDVPVLIETTGYYAEGIFGEQQKLPRFILMTFF